jgi:hypothetical protein
MRNPILALITLSTLTACGGSEASLRERSQDKPSPLLEPIYTEDGMKGERFDLNLDGTADIIKWVRYRDRSGQLLADARLKEPRGEYVEVIMRKEMDTNLDGKMDVIRNYNRRGALTGEQVDTEFDGILETEATVVEGMVTRVTIDLTGDGKPESTRYYRNGQLQRIERDPNSDGLTDTWSHFENQALTRIGTDYDGDGGVDDWKIFHNVAAPAAVPTAAPATPTAAPATPSEAAPVPEAPAAPAAP